MQLKDRQVCLKRLQCLFNGPDVVGPKAKHCLCKDSCAELKFELSDVGGPLHGGLNPLASMLPKL